MKQHKKFFLSLLFLILFAAAACVWYVSDCYRPTDEAMAALASTDTVTVRQQDQLTIFSPSLPQTGFIFYPGGKVSPESYAPLLASLARENVLCVLVSMPGNLAVLDSRAGLRIPALFPEISSWYIGGHSLGGSMAATCAASQPELFQGVVLLAAYSTSDLAGTGLSALSIYGSEDQVLNREKYGQYLSNLPSDFTELIISGGNHANFGHYGPQDGDGTAAISTQNQQEQTVSAILSFLNR